jgi:dihydropyrimidine dehydrogenase (NAD+) subunit PreT
MALVTLFMVGTSFPVHRLVKSPTDQRVSSNIHRLDWLLFTLFVTGMGALLLRGWQFYTLGVGERVDHEDFRALGPSSALGQAYGVAGTLLILTNLLYLVRRRFARLSVGSLRAWLDVHAFTGLFGGMLVVFHSAFQVRSTISMITLGSLFIVIATGLIGRFLYALAPKPDAARLQHQLRLLDHVGPGMGQALSERVARLPRTETPRCSLFAVLAALPRFSRELSQRRALIAQTAAYYAHHRRGEMQRFASSLTECTRLYSAEVRAAAATALLRSWRGVHRFSALLMISLVAMHIAIAWYYGFVWALAD